MDRARFAAKDKTGYIPYANIAWRNYSAIAGDELERARDEFIQRGISPSIVASEHKNAKRRLRDAERREKQWLTENGVIPFEQRADACLSRLKDVESRLGKAKPTSPAAIAALLKLGLVDAFDSEWDWQREAVASAIGALEELAAGGC